MFFWIYGESNKKLTLSMANVSYLTVR